MGVAERVAAQVRTFFEGLYESGAFAARRMEEAFFVVCDRRINTAVSAAAGAHANEFRLLIGFTFRGRADFHSFRISHSAAGSKVQPVTLNRLNLAEYCPEELEWVDRLASQLEPP